jgi:hypothetical protein
MRAEIRKSNKDAAMTDHSAYLMRAITGPVILITIGVLFAFDRFTEFRFGQTWPALLIVLGLLRLVGGGRRGWRGDYGGRYPGSAVPQTPPPPPEPPFGDPGARP